MYCQEWFCNERPLIQLRNADDSLKILISVQGRCITVAVLPNDCTVTGWNSSFSLMLGNGLVTMASVITSIVTDLLNGDISRSPGFLSWLILRYTVSSYKLGIWLSWLVSTTAWITSRVRGYVCNNAPRNDKWR